MGELVKIGSVLSNSRVGEYRQHTRQFAHSASGPASLGAGRAADTIRVVNRFEFVFSGARFTAESLSQFAGSHSTQRRKDQLKEAARTLQKELDEMKRNQKPNP